MAMDQVCRHFHFPPLSSNEMDEIALSLLNSQSSCLQRGQGMARKNVTSASGSPGCALRMSNRSIPGSDDDTNDIDQQSRDRQHPKQRYLGQGNPKQSVQRVAARSDKSDSETGNRQRQGIFNPAREKEALFPVRPGRHGHRSENACRAQWREEAQCHGEATAEFPHNAQGKPEPRWFVALLLKDLTDLDGTRATEPSKEFLRAMSRERHTDDHAEKKECYVHCHCHTVCSFQDLSLRDPWRAMEDSFPGPSFRGVPALHLEFRIPSCFPYETKYML